MLPWVQEPTWASWSLVTDHPSVQDARRKGGRVLCGGGVAWLRLAGLQKQLELQVDANNTGRDIIQISSYTSISPKEGLFFG